MMESMLRALGAGNLSRRTVLKGGAAGAAMLGVSGEAMAAATPAAFDPELFLLDRITFGLDQDMLAEIHTRGYAGFLDWQLDPDQIDDSASEAIVNGIEFKYPLWFDPSTGLPNPAKMVNVLNKTPAELSLQFPDPTSGTTPILLSVYAVMLRAVYSRRQLFYVMSDFFSNVLNRFIFQENQHALWMPFEENVIYPNALGNYGDMVKASAKHCSMMLYLDQHKSEKDSPIENFARELMELHTVGIRNGVSPFTESDVEEVAKILTGWSMHSIDDIVDGFPNPDVYACPTNPMGIDEYGTFVFKQEKHAFGKKVVLGVEYGDNNLPIPQSGCDGLSEGEQLIDDLVARDETAEHIASRMIEWFMMDNPPEPLVQRVASAFSGSGGEIIPTIRALFDPLFLDEIHPAPYLKIRRPFNLATAMIRCTEPDIVTEPLCTSDVPPVCIPGSAVVSGYSWVGKVLKMGQIPGSRQSPDGHPGENAAWTGGLRERLHLASQIAHEESRGLTIDDADLDRIFGVMTATNSLADAANGSVFLAKLSSTEVNRVQTYIDSLATTLTYNALRRECLATIFSTPSYQYLH